MHTIGSFLQRQPSSSFAPSHITSLGDVTSLARTAVFNLLHGLRHTSHFLSLANAVTSLLFGLEHLTSSSVLPSDRHLYVCHYHVIPPSSLATLNHSTQYFPGSVTYTSFGTTLITFQLNILPVTPVRRTSTFRGYHCTILFTDLFVFFSSLHDPLMLNALLSMLCHDLVLEFDWLGELIFNCVHHWHLHHCPACNLHQQPLLCRIHERLHHYQLTQDLTRNSSNLYKYSSIINIVNTPLARSHLTSLASHARVP